MQHRLVGAQAVYQAPFDNAMKAVERPATHSKMPLTTVAAFSMSFASRVNSKQINLRQDEATQLWHALDSLSSGCHVSLFMLCSMLPNTSIPARLAMCCG